jgi:XTP/dITP diphosphohydrolase
VTPAPLPQPAGRIPSAAPLLIATFNPGKARELTAMLAAAGRRAVTLADRGIDVPFEESGATYDDNARGKAEHYARLARLTAIADDSGLEVDALGGAPGPRSARYGGTGLDDAGRCRRLLDELRGLPDEQRTARYVAVVAIARPDGAARLFRGECAGRITDAPRGAGGFGYDPIFFYPPCGATFGEITDERKHVVSHRGVAFARLAAFLTTDEGRDFVAQAPGRNG